MKLRGGTRHRQDWLRVPEPDDTRPDWPAGRPILVFLALFLVMTWPWVLGYVTIPWDAKAHFQPQIQFLASSIARGEAPWWNPYVFSGQPQIADPQSMIFSPPFVALALLTGNPSLWAVDMTVLTCMALGGVGLILWVRDQGWHWSGAIVAALAFSFGASMAWRMQHTGQVLSLAYWPWALLCLDRAIRRESVAWALAAGLFGAMILLGRDQVALLGLYLLAGRAVWLLVEHWAAMRSRVRVFGALIAGGALAVALVAVPLLMTVLLASESNRPVIDLEGAGRGSLHPAQFLTFVVPQLFGAAGHMADYWGPPSFFWRDTGLFTAQNVGQLYIGALPFVLVLIGAMKGWLWDREVRFFTAAAVAMLLYALGWYTPVFQIFYSVFPGVSLYRRPADAVFLIGAMTAILAGYATHRVLREPWLQLPARVVVAVAAIVAATLLAGVPLALKFNQSHNLPLPLAGAALAFIAAAWVLGWCKARFAQSPWLAVVGLTAVLAVDLGINNGANTSSRMPVDYYEVLEPETRNETIAALKRLSVAGPDRRDRIELAGMGFHWPNASMTHRLENTLGYNPVRLRLYSRATGAGDHISGPEDRKFTPLMPSYRSRMADLLGLRFIATPVPVEEIDRQLPAGALKLVARTAEGYIYENEHALPRILFATSAIPADFERLIETGAWPSFDPATTVLLEPGESPPRARASGPASVRILSYTNNEIVLETDSTGGGWVVLNDVWHPWWRATVDGSPAELLRANVIFRAVEVPPGLHTVVMRFRPIEGIWLALARR